MAIVLVGCRKSEDSINTTSNPSNGLEVKCDSIAYSPDTCAAPFNMTLPDGFHELNYLGGQKLAEGHLKNGYADGFWKFYYINGNLKAEGNYTDKKAEGFWKLFFENGNEKSNGHYKDCLNDSFWKYFHESTGTIKEEGVFKRGIRDGDWQYYNEDQNLEETINFDCG